jgi:mycothiol synthase
MLDGITIRNYRPGDVPSMVKLINEADAVDRLERSTTLEQLEHDMTWPNYDAGSDCFLARAGDDLVGYADLFMRRASPDEETQFSGGEHKVFTWGVVHPAWRRRGLGRRFMELLVLRATERLSEVNGGAVHLRGSARDVETGRIALLEAFGMERVRYVINMARRVDGDLPAVEIPPGHRLRSFDLQRDLRTVWEVENLAFQDHWGYTVFPLEEYRHMLERPHSRPDLGLLAVEAVSDKVVGMGFSGIDPDWIEQTGRQEGTVQILAVLREHRRRGLGTALLAQCLHTLRAEGMEWAELGADAENLTGAVRLYKRAGFSVRKTSITFQKVMREA